MEKNLKIKKTKARQNSEQKIESERIYPPQICGIRKGR